MSSSQVHPIIPPKLCEIMTESDPQPAVKGYLAPCLERGSHGRPSPQLTSESYSDISMAPMQVLLTSLHALLQVLQPVMQPSPQPTAPGPAAATSLPHRCVFTVQVVMPKSGPVKMVPAPGEHKVHDVGHLMYWRLPICKVVSVSLWRLTRLPLSSHPM